MVPETKDFTHSRKTYFSLEGNIGSGKSTLLGLLNGYKDKHWETIHEPVKSYSTFITGEGIQYNPLQEIYENPIKSAGFAQLHILKMCAAFYSSKYQESNKSVLISERSLLSPTPFIDAQSSVGHFSPFVSAYLKKELAIAQSRAAGYLPNFTIFLNVEPELCYKRMQGRGRNEEKLVTLEYLKAVDSALKSYFLFRGNTIVFPIQEDSSPLEVFNAVQQVISLLHPDECKK